jgi:hypothetical protein
LDLTFYKELQNKESNIEKDSLSIEITQQGNENRYFETIFNMKTGMSVDNYSLYLCVHLSESFNGDTFVNAILTIPEYSLDREKLLSKSEAERLRSCLYPYFEKFLNKKQADEIFNSSNNFVPVISAKRLCINLESAKSEEPAKNFKGAWINKLKSQGLKIKDFDRTYKLLTNENLIFNCFMGRNRNNLLDISNQNEAWLDLIELEYGN